MGELDGVGVGEANGVGVGVGEEEVPTVEGHRVLEDCASRVPGLNYGTVLACGDGHQGVQASAGVIEKR